MKNRSDILLLEDIIIAIDHITAFINNAEYEKYASDPMLTSAVERKFEIIGEAAGKLSDDVKERYSNIPWHKLTAIRNIIIHGYFTIDLEILYNTAISDLQPLKIQLSQILRDQE
jgi:uncharacterized protein with HEPN domain